MDPLVAQWLVHPDARVDALPAIRSHKASFVRMLMEDAEAAQAGDGACLSRFARAGLESRDVRI